jgi:CRP-like cAMP-binding protein
MFSKFTVIQIFLPGDIVIKQGDEGEKFNIIIDGFVNVVRENRDMAVKKFYEIAFEDQLRRDSTNQGVF